MLIDFFASNYLTLVILFFLAVIVYANRKVNIPAAGLVAMIIMVMLLVEILDYSEAVLTGDTAYQIEIADFQLRIKLRTIVATILYILRPTIILLELFVICPNLTIYIVQLLYVFILLVFTLKSFRGKNHAATLILLSIFITSITAAILEYTSAVYMGSINAVTALCVLAYYVYLSIIYQYEMRETITQKELKIAQNELTILKNQMQPHFIYNALATIRLLAKRDSQKAVKSIDDFSKYLKSHIGAIQNEDLISFTDELENVKVYLSMVQESYRSNIELIYKLEVTEFKLPPLSLEPIVENAVNHGIGRLSGTITISTFTENNHIIIRVKDSGNKDSSSEKYTPYHNGIGLENTAKRLKMQCGGELKTDFSGNGGVVDVILPIAKEEIK